MREPALARARHEFTKLADVQHTDVREREGVGWSCNLDLRDHGAMMRIAERSPSDLEPHGSAGQWFRLKRADIASRPVTTAEGGA